MADEANHSDPLRARALQTVRFRKSDTPEVREALVQEAMRREGHLHQVALEKPRSKSSE